MVDTLLGVLDTFLKDTREDDIFDRITYKFTPMMIAIGAAINFFKLYGGKVIDCFTKAEFKGGWIEYAKDYCFVENTYFLHGDESANMPMSFRKERYISYYQWVPFILAAQALSFYLPHLLFRTFNWITGFHIYSIIKTGLENYMEQGDKRKAAVKSIASVIYNASRVHHVWMNFFDGQRFVTEMYLMMKAANLILICIHMIVFKVFIGKFFYAIDILRHGVEWTSSGLFPRVTLCDMQILRFGAPLNYTMECVLPLNMINEKIFIFLYFWMIILFTLNLFSIYLWLKRMVQRRNYYQFLLNSFSVDDSDWRATSGSSPDDDKTIIMKPQFTAKVRNSHGITSQNLDYGWDVRLVLGLLKEHVGLIFVSSVFREVNRIREENEGRPVSETSSE